MPNGFLNPMAYYPYLPYPYPLFETQPIVRIPVAGPRPFNTVVVVRARVGLTHFGVSDGKLRRYRWAVGTPFQLIGFDPRVSPAFDHSSTGAIQMMQADDDTAFVVALDTVDGQFDDHGNWILTCETADLWDGVFATSFAYLSSWVLCYEPPPPEPPDGSMWQRPHLARPYPSWLVEASVITGTRAVGLVPATSGVPKPRRRTKKLKDCAPADSERHPMRFGDPGLMMGLFDMKTRDH